MPKYWERVSDATSGEAFLLTSNAKYIVAVDLSDPNKTTPNRYSSSHYILQALRQNLNPDQRPKTNLHA